ncbi:hypothetical protein Tco_1497003 [Tanacetum coccineum]
MSSSTTPIPVDLAPAPRIIPHDTQVTVRKTVRPQSAMPLGYRATMPRWREMPTINPPRSRFPSLPPLPSPPPIVLPPPPPPEVVIPKTLVTDTHVRLRKMVEARCWAFDKDSIDTWRLVLNDGQIEEIHDHQREISAARSEFDERIEILEQELETVHSRAEASEARF